MTSATTPPDPLIEERAELLAALKPPEPTSIFGIRFGRHQTTDERLERVFLAAAERRYVETGDLAALQDFKKSLVVTTQPGTTQSRAGAAPKDALDWVRVVATLIMVVALFVIVYVVVLRPTQGQATGAPQLVSLASGLAGIGLGWLFGTSTPRGRGR
jgi:hypothetical protein